MNRLLESAIGEVVSVARTLGWTQEDLIREIRQEWIESLQDEAERLRGQR